MKLDEIWSIEFDSDNTILVSKEKRPNKLGELKEYRDEYFYPTLKSALKSYLNKSMWGSESISEVLLRIEDVERIIENIK